MPGTVVRDAQATELFAGATLNAAGSTNGTAKEVVWPQDVQFTIETGTVTSTGNTATLQVTIQGADDSGFTSNVVKIAAFPVNTGTDAAQSNQTYRLETYIGKRWIRAIVTLGGTAPVYTGSTCKVEQPHLGRTNATTKAAN